MSRVFLLGSTGFLGRNILSTLKKNHEVIELGRPVFDFVKLETFYNKKFSDSIIVDCVNINNGNRDEIYNCNVYGFANFIDFLEASHTNIKYLYFSTISVQDEEARKNNSYVSSKYAAEQYLINSGIVSHIVRLSYPIGKGENSNRLVSRLIDSIREGRELTLLDIKLNFTPVECISSHVEKLLAFEDSIVTFLSNNVYVSLIGVVELLGSLMGIKPQFKVSKANFHFEPMTDSPIKCERELVECLRNMI